MANNGGTVITDTDKLMVSAFNGTAAEVQTAFRAALADADVVISCDTTRKKDSDYITLTVVWYDVA
tara:strand:- start:2795 stop:2992 length:198 start_codon:yes stop_codon:yes gene_type:complete